MRTAFLLALTAVIVVCPLSASDAYIVRFSAHGKISGCHQVRWNDNVLFYNQNDEPAIIRLLDISNGTLLPGTPTTIAIPARQVTSLAREERDHPWAPTSFTDQYALWVLHLDIPFGVTVESRDEAADTDICTPERIFNGATVKVSMPVFRGLVQPNVTQAKLGTDLGSTQARQNVAVYNASTTIANATIEVRSACDNHLIQAGTVSVPANSIVQYGGFATGPTNCTGNAYIQGWSRYILVTVDQPSFSLISTVTEAQPQAPGDILPLVELASSINTTF